MATSALTGRVPPLGNSSEDRLAVANRLASAAPDRLPICRNDTGRVNTSGAADYERHLGLSDELVA